MKINYLSDNKTIFEKRDVEELMDSVKDNILKNKYIDEYIINLNINNAVLLKSCIVNLMKFRFGVVGKLPKINIFIDIENYNILDNMNNDIQDFIVPILSITDIKNISYDFMDNIIKFLKNKNWNLIFILEVSSIRNLEKAIKIYKYLKCTFFDEELYILFKFTYIDNILLEKVCEYIDYMRETINLLANNNDCVINILSKIIKEQETGITQNYEKKYLKIVNKLKKSNMLKFVERKSLIRDSMMDFVIK
mgnify:FL=1